MSGAIFSLSFEGSIADRNILGAYDAAAALRGFERSLALTTHAVLNGNIIVQAPALKGAEIYFEPPARGSWESIALVVLGGMWALNNVSKDSPIGHLLYSAYDYVMKSATGISVDYDKPIRVLLEEAKKQAPEASENFNIDVLDGVIERVERSIEEMHRPIVESKTAIVANITYNHGSTDTKIASLDHQTYEYISQSIERPKPETVLGAISSYNINSFTGRVFVPDLGRTVPFLLSETSRGTKEIDRLTSSLRANALRLDDETMEFEAIVIESVSGRIKRYIIFDI